MCIKTKTKVKCVKRYNINQQSKEILTQISLKQNIAPKQKPAIKLQYNNECVNSLKRL